MFSRAINCVGGCRRLREVRKFFFCEYHHEFEWIALTNMKYSYSLVFFNDGSRVVTRGSNWKSTFSFMNAMKVSVVSNDECCC